MSTADQGNFWDRVGVYIVIAGLFAGGAIMCVLLTQQFLANDPAAAAIRLQADQGDARAQFTLGDAYLYGTLGLKKDLGAAKLWLRKAAAQHYVLAGCQLAGLRFESGDASISDTEAMGWLQDGVQAGDIQCMNSAAWFKATLPDPALRDPRAAESIEKAVLLKQPGVPAFLDTLAAVYAAEGKFDEAVAAQQEAMDRVKASPGDTTGEVNDMQGRLDLYAQHQSYTMPRYTAAAAAAGTAQKPQ